MEFASFFPSIYQCHEVSHMYAFFHWLTVNFPAFKNRFEV